MSDDDCSPISQAPEQPAVAPLAPESPGRLTFSPRQIAAIDQHLKPIDLSRSRYVNEVSTL